MSAHIQNITDLSTDILGDIARGVAQHRRREAYGRVVEVRARRQWGMVMEMVDRLSWGSCGVGDGDEPHTYPYVWGVINYMMDLYTDGNEFWDEDWVRFNGISPRASARRP